MEAANLQFTGLGPTIPSSSDDESDVKGTVFLRLEVTHGSVELPKNAIKGHSVKVYPSDAPERATKINGFGTEVPERGYGGDSAHNHPVTNYVLPDNTWHLPNIVATYEFRTTYECGKPPKLQETRTGDWSQRTLTRSSGSRARTEGH